MSLQMFKPSDAWVSIVVDVAPKRLSVPVAKEHDMSHFACALRQLSLKLKLWQTILQAINKESTTRTVRLTGSGQLLVDYPFYDRDHAFHGGDWRATGTCRMFRYQYVADEAFRQILQLGSLCA